MRILTISVLILGSFLRKSERTRLSHNAYNVYNIRLVRYRLTKEGLLAHSSVFFSHTALL